MNQEEFSERLWDFAARVGKIVDAIPETRLGRHVAAQLVRCGTSAPPNYDESGAAESEDDIIHKPSVALMELRETRGWLRFIVKVDLLSKSKMAQAIERIRAALPNSWKISVHSEDPQKTTKGIRRLKIDDPAMPDARFQDFRLLLR